MSNLIWGILMMVVGAGVLGLLHITATSVGNQIHVHRLNERVSKLRGIMASRAKEKGNLGSGKRAA